MICLNNNWDIKIDANLEIEKNLEENLQTFYNIYFLTAVREDGKTLRHPLESEKLAELNRLQTKVLEVGTINEELWIEIAPAKIQQCYDFSGEDIDEENIPEDLLFS